MRQEHLLELAFELGKRMAYFRPERYLNYALQSLPRLESAFYGALGAVGKTVEGHSENEMTAQLRASMPTAVLEQLGAVLIRHGGKHDWYQNPHTKLSQPVPRHTEINEPLAAEFQPAAVSSSAIVW